MTDSDNTQDDAAMSPASTGPVARDLADSLRGISDTLNVCGNDFSDILYPAARELERLDKLRLTDAERTLLGRLACEGEHPRAWTNRALTADDRATLRGLLERLSDRPEPIADARLAALERLAELDEELGVACTPNPHATPGECRVQGE